MPELDLGNVKGPQGKSAYQSALDAGYSGSEEAFNTAMAKAPDAVLYTAQSLSDVQKAQARTNINAAPGGYGYGDTLAVIDINNDEAAFNSALDALLSGMENHVTKQIRFANYPVAGQQGSTFFGTLYKHDASFAILYGSSYNGGTIQKCKSAGAWQPWEWVNPPMLTGVEYRSVVRYLGKPVYAKVVDCGACPANGYKDVVYGTTGIVLPIRCEGTWSYANRSTIPFESSNEDQLHIGALGGAIRIKTGGKDFSGFTCTATVWYTKTTD